MPSRTYDEWMSQGYKVKKGEKASGRNDGGIATFTETQVVEDPETIQPIDLKKELRRLTRIDIWSFTIRRHPPGAHLILNYRFRLLPSPAQANLLGRSMATLGWGWNLMVRRTAKHLTLIRRGMTGRVQSKLAAHVAEKGIVGRRAEKVNKLSATEGISIEEAAKRVRKEMGAKAFSFHGSRLAMEMAIIEAEAAKQGQMGSSLGSAWAQNNTKYRTAWEACWAGKRGAPVKCPIKDAGWIQAQVPTIPAEMVMRHPHSFGPFRENWIDLARFFPARTTKLPARIKNGTAKSLRGLNGQEKAAEVRRLKEEFEALSDVRLLQHRPFPEGAIVRDIKLTRSSFRPDAVWHVIFAVDVPESAATRIYPVTSKVCGINPARRFALTVVSEQDEPGVGGIEVGPGRPMARSARKLARLQRKLDRQRRANNPDCFDNKGRWIKGKRATKTSKRMLGTEAQIRAVHTHIANQRKDAYNQIATKLLSEFDTICIGDWMDKPPMARRAKKFSKKKEGAVPRKKGEAMIEKLANRMDRDNALGIFRQIVKEKVARSGGFKTILLVHEPMTTLSCAACGAPTGPSGFKQGWWTCPCGHRQLRGRTAGYNILQRGKAMLQNQSLSTPPPGDCFSLPPTRGRGAGQALKGGSDPTVGRMLQSKGASASDPARGNRKASTPSAHRAGGLSAPVRATSTVSPLGVRGSAKGASLSTEPGEAKKPTAETALTRIRGSQVS